MTQTATRPEDRDAARALWTASGLRVEDLTDQDLRDLRRAINDAMIASDLIKGTFRCRQRFSRKSDFEGRLVLDLQCRSFYFDSRQAITIEGNGFVGFAGWADTTNIVPVLEGFGSWLEARTAKVAA